MTGTGRRGRRWRRCQGGDGQGSAIGRVYDGGRYVRSGDVVPHRRSQLGARRGFRPRPVEHRVETGQVRGEAQVPEWLGVPHRQTFRKYDVCSRLEIHT